MSGYQWIIEVFENLSELESSHLAGPPVSARGWRRNFALAGKRKYSGGQKLNGDIPRSVLLTGIMMGFDILVNGIWGRIELLRNIGTRQSPNSPLPPGSPLRGKTSHSSQDGCVDSRQDELVTQWRTTPVAVDWDQDGLTDLVMLDHEGYLSWFRRVRQDGELSLLGPERVFYSLNNSVTNSGHGVIDMSGVLRLNNREAGAVGDAKFGLPIGMVTGSRIYW